MRTLLQSMEGQFYVCLLYSMLLNVNVESRRDPFCCSESFSKPRAYLNSEGSTLVFHPLLICTVNECYYIN